MYRNSWFIKSCEAGVIPYPLYTEYVPNILIFILSLMRKDNFPLAPKSLKRTPYTLYLAAYTPPVTVIKSLRCCVYITPALRASPIEAPLKGMITTQNPCTINLISTSIYIIMSERISGKSIRGYLRHFFTGSKIKFWHPQRIR